MVEKRRGLGRGLGALISGSPSSEDESPPQVVNEASASSESHPTTPPPAKTTRDTATSAPKQSSTVDRDRADTQEPAVSESSAVSRETSSQNMKTTHSNLTSVTDKKATTSAISGNDKKTGSAASNNSDTQDTTETEAKQTGSSGTRSPRKSRPVDMFFTPGRAETDGEARATSDTVSNRRISTNSNRRVAVPDVLGKVRSPREETNRSVGSSPADEAVAPPEELPAQEAEDWHESQEGNEANQTAEEVSRETLVAVPGATFAEVAVESIHPNRKQPRTVFDDDDMAELVHSIREVGLLQPIVLRPSEEGGDQQYELVMGERRWRAVQEAGLATIPAIVRETSDTALLRDALLENLHRSQLNPLEEAAAYQQLMQEFECTQDELSERIGRSRPQISNTIRLMRLPALVQRRVAAGVLSAGHARALLGLQDVADMERLAQRIVNEGLSVRATEEIVSMNDGLRRKTKDKVPRSTARHERLDYLANSLSDHLDTNVKISLGAKKGRVSIEFGSVDDLNRIMGVIAPSADQ